MSARMNTGRPATEEAWQPHEAEALAAIAAASDSPELEDARVRYLGRKSEVAQALRGVRDRDAGMLLNGIRRRLEEALDERRVELERAGARSGAGRATPSTSPFPARRSSAAGCTC